MVDKQSTVTVLFEALQPGESLLIEVDARRCDRIPSQYAASPELILRLAHGMAFTPGPDVLTVDLGISAGWPTATIPWTALGAVRAPHVFVQWLATQAPAPTPKPPKRGFLRVIEGGKTPPDAA